MTTPADPDGRTPLAELLHVYTDAELDALDQEITERLAAGPRPEER